MANLSSKQIPPSQSSAGEAGPPTESAPAPYPAAPPRKCSAEVLSDGTARVTFYIDADVVKRHLRRAHTQDLGEYLWANVLRSAVESSVY